MKPECDKPPEWGKRTKRPVADLPPAPASSAEYVELHAHSQHSLRDSAAHVEDLVERAKALGMTAMAITDHDSAAVAPEFRAAALASEIRPIQGAEISFKGTPDGPFHLTLLAEDDDGFGNLCEILTRARSMRFDTAPVREGSKTPWGKASIPLATPEMLEGKTEHLLCLTGCVKSELSHHLLRREDDLAEQTLARWVALFGANNVFVELQDHRLGFEPSLNARKCDLARRFGLPVVATNNVHTLAREDFWVHEALACWRAGRQSRRT
ncbi:MAG: PHP domain-containing protein, partial [Armatimonadetes bacterium]|nr:PHP domain-containing protein [Armatimonadota bacterium]